MKETVLNEYSGNYAGSFFRPYRVEAKWTTLEQGASLTVSTLRADYSSHGMAYDYPGFEKDLGDRTHTIRAQDTSVNKGYRIGKTEYPAGYALDYLDNYDYGSTLTVTVLINGRTSSDSIGVKPDAQSNHIN